MSRYFCLILFCFISYLGSALAADTSTKILNPYFKTLKVSNSEDFYLPPTARLGTDDRIIISFDEISEDRSYLQYRLIHCNADWQPSRLIESEYLDGFNIAEINDYGFSSNTFIHYVNYRIEIPNDDMSPLVSGNYLIQVFDRNEPDETLLQARFSISENTSVIAGSASARTDRGVNDEWQQLNISVDLPDGMNINPYSDLIIFVTQNGRESTRRQLKAPLRITGNRLTYEHAPELIFPAGNEYRRFETVRADYPGMHVDSARYMGSNYHAFLNQDESRASTGYVYDQTQNGRFLVREYNSTDSDLGADYVTVHFTLSHPEIMDADVYVEGEMTYGQYNDTNRMIYDRTNGEYSLQMPLKQGSYNYQYVVKGRNPGDIPYPSVIEGNKYETRNEYEVEVFLRTPGARADRLIGRNTLYSF